MSIRQNYILDKTDSFYSNNTSLKKLTSIFEDYYNIPKHVTKNTIQKYLVDHLTHNEEDKEFKHFREQKTKSLLYLVGLLFYLFITLPAALFFSIKTKKIFSSILCEEIFQETKYSLYDRFYRHILYYINSDFFIYFTNFNRSYYGDNKFTNFKGYIKKRFVKNIFPFGITLKVILVSLFKYYDLAKLNSHGSIDVVYIYIRLIKNILVYNAEGYKVKANVFITALPYEWSPIKYIILKKSYKNIFILQQNDVYDRTNTNIYNLYADSYFAFSKYHLKKFSDVIYAREKYAVGSVVLNSLLLNKQNDFNKKYDISIMYGEFDVPFFPYTDRKIHFMNEKFIDNIMLFAINNPSITLYFIIKPKKSLLLKCEKRFSSYKNIILVDSYGIETLKFISQSKLFINTVSTLGIQSYALDTNVLWINYNNVVTNIKGYNLPYEESDLDVISNPEYKKLEEKILDYLYYDTNSYNDILQEKKKNFIEVDKNSAEIIAKKVRAAIS